MHTHAYTHTRADTHGPQWDVDVLRPFNLYTGVHTGAGRPATEAVGELGGGGGGLGREVGMQPIDCCDSCDCYDS